MILFYYFYKKSIITKDLIYNNPNGCLFDNPNG